MSSEHFEHDPVLVAIASLRARDVGARHADRLRGSCHALLENRPRRNRSSRCWLARHCDASSRQRSRAHGVSV